MNLRTKIIPRPLWAGVGGGAKLSLIPYNPEENSIYEFKMKNPSPYPRPHGAGNVIFFLIAAALLILSSPKVSAAPYAYPVPFVESRDGDSIHFKDLPLSGTIEIFTIAGEAVVKLDIPVGFATQDWNTQNAAGKKVATGVYFFRIHSDGEETKGKLVVIR